MCVYIYVFVWYIYIPGHVEDKFCAADTEGVHKLRTLLKLDFSNKVWHCMHKTLQLYIFFSTEIRAIN